MKNTDKNSVNEKHKPEEETHQEGLLKIKVSDNSFLKTAPYSMNPSLFMAKIQAPFFGRIRKTQPSSFSSSGVYKYEVSGSKYSEQN